MFFIGQGPPQTLRDDHPNKPWMTIPIYPTTSHPLGREPLNIEGGLLPWDNCYFHSIQGGIFEIGKVYPENPSNITISLEEIERATIISEPDNDLAQDGFRQEAQAGWLRAQNASPGPMSSLSVERKVS